MGPDYTAPPPGPEPARWQVKSKEEAIEASDFGPEVARKEVALIDGIGKRVDENKKRETR